ncbi:MAG: hypothetical protein ABWK53_06465 [Anaerolineales bacterium]
MTDGPPFESPSLRRHRKQRAWHILLPFLLTALLALGGAALAAFGGGTGQARLWADISLIWLILPALFFALLCLAVLIGVIYLLARLTRAVPPVAAKIQFFSRRVANGARQAADKAAQPVVWLRQAGAMLKAALRLKGR